MKVLDRVRTPNAFRDCCRLAAMANEPRPTFVNWGKVYSTTDGDFRIVCELGGRELINAYIERVAA
jgi:hypothetical protein